LEERIMRKSLRLESSDAGEMKTKNASFSVVEPEVLQEVAGGHGGGAAGFVAYQRVLPDPDALHPGTCIGSNFV
jgi:hypothetical protein